jgi:ATP-dependent helicase HrpA
MNFRELPVYQQKDRILASLESHQVVVVESPTGSGKTTQIPVILNEAGYSRNGIIGVTQPRRIAAISVTEFISKQLGTKVPGLVGYKMRFEDKTDPSTVIKIMTDGILLQEMKLDPLLSRYGVLMVDEAHERSLNIDFILGLLKRVMEERPEFKVVVSSATINAEVFSAYFGDCPIVKIDTPVYPVTVVYDPPVSEGNPDAVIDKVESTVVRVVSERRAGDILVFLPGERAIKDCIQRLAACEVRRSLHLIPLYGRLGKDEQERVFERAPFGKTKVIVSTNIAETSVTIDGITSVIDSGLAKLNFYNPRTYTASLVEVPTSKASSNQRKGRAGRTQPGTCYRLFGRDDFENRALFTMEEIYRTDLSEVVLRMAELGITDFELFDFISKPAKTGIRGAVEALGLLDALNPDRTLSTVGQKMCLFPLLPRHSRILVEAIMSYPDVVEEALIGTAFLSTQGPFLLPPGQEMEARAAHHAFRDPAGDFVSYLKMFRQYTGAQNPVKYCEKNYLDERTMAEIVRVKEQLELIVADMGVPILSGGSTEDYLCAVSRGLIQFVCARQDRGMFRSLTADRIQIHPGSVMFKENPQFIVAGEIVRTTRMYAMSVSPLQKHWLPKISPLLAEGLLSHAAQKSIHSQAVKAVQEDRAARDFTNQIKIAGEVFKLEIGKKKKKVALLEWNSLKRVQGELGRDSASLYKNMKGVVTKGSFRLLDGEKLDLILRVAPHLDLDRDIDRDWPHKKNFAVHEDCEALVSALDHVLQVSRWKPKSSELGFVALFTDSAGSYWFRVSRGFHTALNESLASLEALVDDIAATATPEEKKKVDTLYRKLSEFFD